MLSNGTQPIVEMQALYAIELLEQYMKRAYNDVQDGEAWSKVTLASTLGGMNINMAGVTAPHGMEHPASGLIVQRYPHLQWLRIHSILQRKKSGKFTWRLYKIKKTIMGEQR